MGIKKNRTSSLPFFFLEHFLFLSLISWGRKIFLCGDRGVHFFFYLQNSGLFKKKKKLFSFDFSLSPLGARIGLANKEGEFTTPWGTPEEGVIKFFSRGKKFRNRAWGGRGK